MISVLSFEYICIDPDLKWNLVQQCTTAAADDNDNDDDDDD